MRKTDFDYAVQYLNPAAKDLILDGTLEERLNKAKRCLAAYVPSEDCFGKNVATLKDRLAQGYSDIRVAESIAGELFRLCSTAIAASRNWYTYDEEDEYSQQFRPYRDVHSEESIETGLAFAARLKSTLLPNFPEEVLIEWFFRHQGCLGKYAFLRYEKFRFQKADWKLTEIPRFEDAVAGAGRFPSLDDIPNEWLVAYMLKNHTWNTPIILLDNQARRGSCDWLKAPFHLLEGHRRLFYLNELRQRGVANSIHAVWVVTLSE